MKNLLRVLILLAYSVVSAQPEFTPGIRAGVNFAKVSDTELGYKTGFYAGASAGIKFNKVYTLQPEIMFSAQGAKGDYEFDQNGINEIRHADVSLQYVCVGVINKFEFADRISVMVGPSIDILVDKNVAVHNDLDISIVGGLGCRIIGGLGAEFRVKKGFVSTLANSDYTTSDGFFDIDNSTNLVLQLGLTYIFTTKDKPSQP